MADLTFQQITGINEPYATAILSNPEHAKYHIPSGAGIDSKLGAKYEEYSVELSGASAEGGVTGGTDANDTPAEGGATPEVTPTAGEDNANA